MSQVLAVAPSALPPSEETHVSQAVDRIRDALRGLRFGEVTVIVQDGVVVQVERTEKLRVVRRERDPHS